MRLSPQNWQWEPDKKNFTVRVVTDEQEKREFDYILKHEHYLGVGQEVGHSLRQLVELEGIVVGLLTWGPAAYKLKERDEWIGWDHWERRTRLNLIVQNRRFYTMNHHIDNLCSQVLSHACKALPRQWYEHFGYEPVLAETFTDPQLFLGTIYKASNWVNVGQSKGYSRVHDHFYDYNYRPKVIWLYPLVKKGKERLLLKALPLQQQAGLRSEQPQMELKQQQLESLFELFDSLEDRRRRSGRRYRLGSVLATVAIGVMMGYEHIAKIIRMSKRLKQHQLRALRFWRNPKDNQCKAPSKMIFYNCLKNVNLEQFQEQLRQWWKQYSDDLPRHWSLDGKAIGNIVYTLSLTDHDSGVPAAITSFDKGQEIAAAEKVIDSLDTLENQTVTADALHCQQKLALKIVEEKHGDYLLQVKDNQGKLKHKVESLLHTTPFLPRK